MKKLFIIVLLEGAFTSCSSSDDSDSCNCEKSYYNYGNSIEATFVNSEPVECTDEVGVTYIDSDTYFTIDCE